MGLKKLALWVDKPYQEDRLFRADGPLNRDNCLSSMRLLRDALAARGWECRTHDIYRADGVIPDAVLFSDRPKGNADALLGGWAGRARKLLLLMECEVIKPENWAPGAHEGFDAVFTWDERYVDNKKYFKVNFANPFPAAIPADLGAKTGFCLMITANKKSRHPLELYSERERTASWFEREHPADFDLYGMGWDRRVFTGPAPLRALNRLPALARLAAPRHPCYRGTVAEKRPVISRYRFSVCYENAREIPGYITEKIFDCLFSGNVPVYWGAPDIAKYIPQACFIDRREFRSHEQLYSFLKGMSDAEFGGYLQAARDYVFSPAAYPFTDRSFAETVGKVVAGE